MRDQDKIPVGSDVSTNLKGYVESSLTNWDKGVWKILQEKKCTFHAKSLKNETIGCLPAAIPVCWSWSMKFMAYREREDWIRRP